jgi:hypothetical protein
VSGDQGASMRATDVGLTLGATGDQVQGAYEGAAQVSTHPAGQVHVAEAPDGSDNGIAYVTDGSGVVEINVGNIDVIPQPDVCT